MESKTLRALKREYATRVSVPQSEYEQMQKELSKTEFYYQYEMQVGDSPSYTPMPMKLVYERTDEELGLILSYRQILKQEEIEKQLRTIKGCAIFFVVLMIISIIASVVLLQPLTHLF